MSPNKIDQIWEENAGKMVYNIKSKTLDFGNLSAPKYKYNKDIFMPDPESPQVEVLHELRRTEMNRIFNRACCKSSPSKQSKDAIPAKNKINGSSEINLSKNEINGLKSLKKRVEQGNIVVVETDKSKKFALLTREQYIESGLQHTNNDLEIQPENVKRVQNVVNDHVHWLQQITGVGKNCGHEDRMRRNLIDKGEQVCQMSLLIKDHKKWSCGSAGPIPSRPVISGNSGLNCHLSEIISKIIDPVADEIEGNEVDSTDEMLAKINKLKVKLSNSNLSYDANNVPVENLSTENLSNENELNSPTQGVSTLPVMCENAVKHSDPKFPKSDIRNFGKSGLKTSDSSKEANKRRLSQAISDLKNKRAKNSIIPTIADRMNAGKLVDVLEGNCPIKLPESQINQKCNVPKQKSEGLSIVGSDVKSLFPSLKSVETARLARCAILDSKVTFENWDYLKALRYLFIVGGSELIRKQGLSRLMPTWLGDREDLLAVGGSKSKEESNWSDTSREIHDFEKRKIIAAVVEVAVNVVQTTHIYKFCGKYFIQLEGGPIGLSSTASLASLVMKLWDVAWLALMKRENIDILLFFRDRKSVV